MEQATKTISVAIVDDFQVVVRGVAELLRPHDDLAVVELSTGEPVTQDVDVVLFDTFAQSESHGPAVELLIASSRPNRVAVYSWNLDPALISAAQRKGVDSYFSKAWTADELADAVRRCHSGEFVAPDERTRPAVRINPALEWPGKDLGLTAREAQVMAMLTAGNSNAVIAEKLYISVNSVKTHLRNAYRKVGVGSRAQAVLWGIDHGMRVPRRAIDDWVG